jgi:hypothetical protein
MWLPVHFRTEPPPVECAGKTLLSMWDEFAGKPVLVEHINDSKKVQPTNDEPICECEHLFRVYGHYSERGGQAVVCANCLEMD